MVERLKEEYNFLNKGVPLMKKWLTIQEASSYINRSTRQIHRYISDGRLKGYQSGIHCRWLFEAKDLDAWVMFDTSFAKLSRTQKELING